MLLLLWSTVIQAQEVLDPSEATDETSLTPEEILLKVYDRTGGFRWTSHVNWLSEDICSYEGVACYPQTEALAGHVREVDLASNHLVGTLPGDIFALPYLETLIVRDNPNLVVTFDNAHEAQHLKNLVISNTQTQSLTSINAVLD